MNAARAASIVVALTFLAGAAAADSVVQSSGASIDGRSDVHADGAALFVIIGKEGLLWEGSAASADLDRVSASWIGASWPSGDAYVARWFEQPVTASDSYGPVTLLGTGSVEQGAILIRADGLARVDATSEGLVRLVAQTDPRFDQQEPAPSVGQDPDYAIHEQIEGSFVNTTLPGGALVLTGDLVVTIYGADYEINGEPERTGDFATQQTPATASGRDERHVLHLHGATLRLRTLAPLYLISDSSTIAFDGTLQAEDALGAAADPGARWSGGSAVSVASADGLLTLREPGAATTQAAVLDQGPPVALLSLALLVACALALGGLLVWRRRERADDLAVALLAMEERRWSDALPPLTRIAARRPGDAGVIIDRALCLEQLGRLQEAARAFESALRAAPRHAEAHLYYARTLARLEQREAGRVHLETALEIDPRLADMARSEPILRTL